MSKSFILLLAVLFAHAQAKYVAPNWKVPGISAKDVPQMIVITHDDNTDSQSSKAVTEITRKHSNPNGCKVPAAFFTTSSLSDCKHVKALYDIGHEIACHTVSHKSLPGLSSSQKKKEVTGARKWIIGCGVKSSDVVGHRSPFLEDDVEVRDILNDNGFLYDASISEIFPSPTSPSAKKRLFPYSFDKGNPQVYSCKWFDNTNNCVKSEKHAGLFELPLWVPQKGNDNPATQDSMDPAPNTYNVLKAEFERNYKANRAPVGIWTHTSTGYLTQKKVRDEISKFLGYALSQDDVWVVTPRQLIDYMQNPVPASKMASFMKKYKCSKTGVPKV